LRSRSVLLLLPEARAFVPPGLPVADERGEAVTLPGTPASAVASALPSFLPDWLTRRLAGRTSADGFTRIGHAQN